ncbi:MAG: 1-(5-phosphoribosyl)-5-[(5-phosphoribosylamino)methylideneamino]imidazole-4-carboxamide isomerase [Gemmatimonadaceae bacterium]|nr:1-(5-phosphoribosyl)-5-[(5-phosphoribosylamino)methylideneamino]imidazole-4-carboxamide isomerase [Chitinophagaceae bacterium]
MEIIPAIDIIDGSCVRLTGGDYSQKKIYHTDPLEVAKSFEDAGIRRLHLVDLDGAKAGAVKNWKVLENICSQTDLSVDFGGGVKAASDLEKVFAAGADFATIGSLAVKNENEFVSWIEKYGGDKFLLGADVKEEMIAIGGWLESTNIRVLDFIETWTARGITQIFCTDISKDGKLEGPSLELYKMIIARFPTLNFIASGGVSSFQDLADLAAIGCKGAIVGKAIYEGRIDIASLSDFNQQQTR